MRRIGFPILTLVAVLLGDNGCAIFSSEDSNLPDLATRLTLVNRDSLPVFPGQSISIAVRFEQHGAAKPGEVIDWRIVNGNGTLSDTSTITDFAGVATVSWVVGPGGRQRIAALRSIGAQDTIVRYISAVIGRLEIVSGDSQHIASAAPALATLVVRWVDDNGQPGAFQYIRWRTDIQGVTLQGRTFTDVNGASGNFITYQAGATGQPGRITASVSDHLADSVSFTVLTDHRLRLVSGGNQIGPAHLPLPMPVEVSYDNPANGEAGPPAPFRWEVVTGEGTVRDDFVPWNGTGPMRNVWTLGPTVGTQSIRIFRADGQGNDTLLVSANGTGTSGTSGCGGVGTLHQSGVQVLTPQTWTAASSPHVVRGQVQFGPAASLTIEPGVVVCLESMAGLYLQNTLRAIGTPATPIRFAAADTTLPWNNIILAGTSSALSEISNARIEHGFVPIIANAPVRIDSSIIRQSRSVAILIDNAWSSNRVIHTTVDTTGSISNAGVIIRAPGTVFAGTVHGVAGPVAVLIAREDVTLQECTISRNSGIGVIVDAVLGTRIGSCNFTNQVGLAVRAAGGWPVDARSNWWGSAAGPALGGPNGVSADVDASSPRIGEINVGYRPTW